MMANWVVSRNLPSRAVLTASTNLQRQTEFKSLLVTECLYFPKQPFSERTWVCWKQGNLFWRFPHLTVIVRDTVTVKKPAAACCGSTSGLTIPSQFTGRADGRWPLRSLSHRLIHFTEHFRLWIPWVYSCLHTSNRYTVPLTWKYSLPFRDAGFA